MPFDILKVDRGLIDGLDTLEGIAIVDAVLGIGHSLGISTVAEGVETAAQMRLLARARVRAGAGILLVARDERG